jgi:hypothetical protein
MPDDVYSPSAGDLSEGEGGGGNFLTKRLGPLPTYMWIIVVIAVYYLYRHYISSGTSTATTTGTTTDASGNPIDTSGTTGTIDSTGNVNDSLTALGQTVALQAANIATLTTELAAAQKEEKQLSLDVAALNRRTKPKPKPKPKIVIHKRPVHKKPTPRKPVHK